MMGSRAPVEGTVGIAWYPVGIAWYRAQDYAQSRGIMADAASFQATCREWREPSDCLESDRQG